MPMSTLEKDWHSVGLSEIIESVIQLDILADLARDWFCELDLIFLDTYGILLGKCCGR
jgi:predicted O-methyltransferase YrrM